MHLLVSSEKKSRLIGRKSTKISEIPFTEAKTSASAMRSNALSLMPLVKSMAPVSSRNLQGLISAYRCNTLNIWGSEAPKSNH